MKKQTGLQEGKLTSGIMTGCRTGAGTEKYRNNVNNIDYK